MMLYAVKKPFQDRTDEMRGYQPNDWYPRVDFNPTDERLQVLVDGGFIESVEEDLVDTEYPLATGGGWYELSNGERVQGKKEATKAEQSLKEGD